MMGNTLKRFWAFKNSLFVMKNLLNLKKGDEMIFLFIKTTKNHNRNVEVAYQCYRAQFPECAFLTFAEALSRESAHH